MEIVKDVLVEWSVERLLKERQRRASMLYLYSRPVDEYKPHDLLSSNKTQSDHHTLQAILKSTFISSRQKFEKLQLLQQHLVFRINFMKWYLENKDQQVVIPHRPDQYRNADRIEAAMKLLAIIDLYIGSDSNYFFKKQRTNAFSVKEPSQSDVDKFGDRLADQTLAE